MTATTRLGTTNASPDWDLALCAQTDPDLFVPDGAGQQITTAVKQAKWVCGRCSIRSGCLSWALETREPAGVWGGLDERERRRVLGVVESQIERCWEQQERIVQQLAAGVSQRQIAEQLEVSSTTLGRWIVQFEQERATSAGGVRAA